MPEDTKTVTPIFPPKKKNKIIIISILYSLIHFNSTDNIPTYLLGSNGTLKVNFLAKF